MNSSTRPVRTIQNLRSEVESLISSLELSGDFIEGSAADVAASLLESESLRGKQVAQFQVGDLLGRGGMGEVYSATDQMGRQVALKVLAPRLVQDRQHVTRFLQEARAVLALNHPNIVTVYDIGEADGIYYIASELIEGETLRAVLSRGRLELAQSMDIAIQVSTALVAAHDKGIVHRDIKPENVMLRGDGYVKVLDFGIAKLTEQFGGAGSPRRDGRGQPGDGRGPHRRNDPVHVAGAGARHASGRAHRRMELRRPAVRDDRRPDPVLRAAARRMCSPGYWSASPPRSQASSTACRRNCSASSRGP